MNFKEGIREEALNKIEPINTGSVNTFVNQFTNETDIVISLYWYSEDKEFEYIYSGKNTICRWLKGKGYSFYIKTPKIIKALYNEIYNERLNK